MDSSHLKNAVDQFTRFPLPHSVVDALVDALLCTPSDGVALTRIVLCTPPLLADFLKTHSTRDILQHAPDRLLARMSDDAIAAWITQLLATTVLQQGTGLQTSHEESGYLRHSLSCALWAEAISDRNGVVSPDLAYTAGLLHDVGKLALAAAASTAGYSEIRTLVQREGLTWSDAERSHLGVDHTIAGKRVLEQMGLPQHFVDVAWLHHHPIDTLHRLTGFGDLVRVVAVANTLSNTDPHALIELAQGSFAKPLASCGLDINAVNEIAEWVARETDSRFAPLVASQSPTAMRQVRLNTVLARALLHDRTADIESAAMSALNDWTALAQQSGQHVSLEHLLLQGAKMVRNVLSAGPGVCYVTDIASGVVTARGWKNLNDEPALRIIKFHKDKRGAAEIDTAMQAMLKEYGLGGIATSWMEQVHDRSGVIVVPLFANEKSYGQIVVDCSAQAERLAGGGLARVQSVASILARFISWRFALNVARDQTETFAQALRVMSAELEASVRTTPSAFDFAPIETSPKQTADIQQFSGGAAQVLEGPLSVIASIAQQMRAKNSEPEVQASLEAILNQARLLRGFMGDLRALGAPKGAHVEARDVNNIARSLIEAISTRLARKKIQVVEQYNKSIPPLQLDPQRFAHALLNVIQRVERMLEKTGGRLTVASNLSADGHTVMLQVSHDGDVLTPPALQELFEPFSEVSPQSDRGLELSVCRAIVEEHGGKIRAESNAVVGTVFTLELPVEAGVPVEIEMPAEPGPPATTILIADDDEGVREILKQALQMRGYQVIGVADGGEAMRVLRDQPVDVVLVDLMMPNHDGFTVLRGLRDIPSAPPALVMTGNSSAQVQEEAMTLGASVFMLKPFELRKLLAELESMIPAPRR